MNRTRVLRVLTRWRAWWDSASDAFVVWLPVVLFGGSGPRFPRSVVPPGLPIPILLFFVGFARLVRRRRTVDG